VDKDRVFGLDILRAFAIIFVMLVHGNALLPASISKLISFFILDGVSIFFVLSGFLIGRILIKILSAQPANGKTLWNFWIRRWFRTLPNYFLVLLILAGLHLIFSQKFTLNILPEYVLFVQNLTKPHPWFFPEAWSLSIEEWFYLVIPILLVIFIRFFQLNRQYAVLIVALSIIIVSTSWRWMNYISLEEINNLTWNLHFRKQVITRLDSIMFGVIGAYAAVYLQRTWAKNRKILFGVGIVLFLSLNSIRYFQLAGYGLYQCVFSFTATAVATLCLLPLLSTYQHRKKSGTIYYSVTVISLVSYSMYLINLTLVKNSIIGVIPWSEFPTNFATGINLLKYALYWILTIGISIVMYKYFELPIMRLRNRFS
jgi:peptidoglycan/LPS O-acetylase OafA/YrhL